MKVAHGDFRVVWVSNFYDHPLNGLGIYQGRWVSFAYVWEEETDEDIGPYELTVLTFSQFVVWWSRKTLFEICVGRHWTYRDGRRARWFHWRRPHWLGVLLFNLYYGRRPLFHAPGTPKGKA